MASSSEYRLIDAALEHFGLRDRFALIHSAEDEDYGKPHPAVFLTAASKLGAPPKRCLVWEDAPAGVVAAKAASMACIAVPEPGEGAHPAFGLADLVVDSLEDVDDVVVGRDRPSAFCLGCGALTRSFRQATTLRNRIQPAGRGAPSGLTKIRSHPMLW